MSASASSHRDTKRLEPTVRNLLHGLGVIHSDSTQIAGGAKCLVSPDHDSSREFDLQQIRLQRRFHGGSRYRYFVDFEGVWATHAPCGKKEPPDSREREPPQFQAKSSNSFPLRRRIVKKIIYPKGGRRYGNGDLKSLWPAKRGATRAMFLWKEFRAVPFSLASL